jgi:hypothetical protein
MMTTIPLSTPTSRRPKRPVDCKPTITRSSLNDGYSVDSGLSKATLLGPHSAIFDDDIRPGGRTFACLAALARRRIKVRGRATLSHFAGRMVHTFRRLDLAKVSKATASTMMTPMTICWM